MGLLSVKYRALVKPYHMFTGGTLPIGRQAVWSTFRASVNWKGDLDWFHETIPSNLYPAMRGCNNIWNNLLPLQALELPRRLVWAIQLQDNSLRSPPQTWLTRQPPSALNGARHTIYPISVPQQAESKVTIATPRSGGQLIRFQTQDSRAFGNAQSQRRAIDVAKVLNRSAEEDSFRDFDRSAGSRQNSRWMRSWESGGVYLFGVTAFPWWEISCFLALGRL